MPLNSRISPLGSVTPGMAGVSNMIDSPLGIVIGDGGPSGGGGGGGALLQESGDYILTESGDRILIES